MRTRMMNGIRGLMVSGFLLVGFVCAAQVKPLDDVLTKDDVREPFKYSVSVEPLYLLNTGLRVNFETRLPGPQRHLLQVSGIGYYRPHFDTDHWPTLFVKYAGRAEKIGGGGLGVDYKYFFSGKLRHYYVSGGATYHYFNLTYRDTELVSFVEDGLTFYESRQSSFSAPYNKLGVNCCFGIQSRWRNAFLADVYAGVGYSYSFYDKYKFDPGNSMHSIGYRGVTLLLGVRFGVRFGK